MKDSLGEPLSKEEAHEIAAELAERVPLPQKDNAVARSATSCPRCHRLEVRIAFMLKALELAWVRIHWRSPDDAAAIVIQDALDTGRRTEQEAA